VKRRPRSDLEVGLEKNRALVHAHLAFAVMHRVGRIGVNECTPGDRQRAVCLRELLGRVAFEQRFAALTDGPVAFETRFASADDCPPSFDANLESAMEALASSLRPAPDQTVASANAVAKPVIPRARPRPAPVRRELPAIDDDGRTAIYDITARTVYLPSGRRLEAHSGFGAMMDNPRRVHVRMKSATPPNVYMLTLRERLFHGVRAIHLNPINDSRMYGRAGILAHTYMLGANGQSNGCVSFNDYDEFLNAYLRGEITCSPWSSGWTARPASSTPDSSRAPSKTS
jgi:type VI secretion system (T6SS) effector TldE1-like protein